MGILAPHPPQPSISNSRDLRFSRRRWRRIFINLQGPCVLYIGREYSYAPDVAFYIFSPVISTEYFKHAAYSPCFSSKCRLFNNATFLVHVLFTFYIQCVLNLNVKFKVCKSVHHRTIQLNHQPDATIFQFIILTFVYSSTCFGRFAVHHQELNYCSGNLWFNRFSVVIVLLVVVGPAGPTTNTTRLSPRYEGKTRGCHCSNWAPDDGRENARNMLSCKQTSGL
jgi:hypothetical protein